MHAEYRLGRMGSMRLLAAMLCGVLLMLASGGEQLQAQDLVGYWHNWDDRNAPWIRPDTVDDRYTVINVAFAVPASASDMRMTFVPEGVGEAGFIDILRQLRQDGKKVLLSVGGANHAIDLSTEGNRMQFVGSLSALLAQFEFDGLDIDIEHGNCILIQGGTVEAPTNVAQINLIEAIREIMDRYRSRFSRKMMLTFAPETAYVQGGQSAFGGIWGGYLPILHALRDSIDILQVQLYNSGTMYGLDGMIHTQGTTDFIVAMTEAVIQGFNTSGGVFHGFPASKVAIGLPAGPRAAGGGFIDMAGLSAAARYLLGTADKPGAYALRNPGGYPDLRGLMTWSINWDAISSDSGTYVFARTFSDIFRASVLSVPDRIALLAPSNGSEHMDKVSFHWRTGEPAVERYQFQLRDGQTATVILDTMLSDTALALEGLRPGTVFQWKARASNSAGVGEWSDTWSFSTKAKKYSLTVINGEGSGDYSALDTVLIRAIPPITGGVFEEWIGDTAFVEDRNAEETRVILPEKAIMLEARFRQHIILQPIAGQMACTVRVPGLPRQSFILGLPETIGSSEGMILNFPEVNIQWEGPDAEGRVWHRWVSAGKVDYSVTLIPGDDYVDAEMSIRNLGRAAWSKVFSFNCLNPAGADNFRDWTLERTYMSRDGRPFRMDSTTRINEGSMSTVQFYLNEGYAPVSPFISGFRATSPQRTDDSYIVTLSADGQSYMAATSPRSCFLFDNLDRCCIHSATDFGSIPPGVEVTQRSRFYFANGTLGDFLDRFETEVKGTPDAAPRVAMCYGNPWVLADTTQWSEVLDGIDILKIYIGNIDARVDPQQARTFVSALLAHDVKIAVELGGLLDWHAAKGEQSAEASFQQEFSNVRPLQQLIKSIDPARGIDMLDMDGPIRRMLFPNNKKSDSHTLESAMRELSEVVRLWRDSIPGIEINLLTNFPNWAWEGTPAYFAIDGHTDGYGDYGALLDTLAAESRRSGLRFDGLTVDNPYDYAIGRATSNQPALIVGVDWMQRLAGLDTRAKAMGMKVNMIFNTNGARDAQGYSEQTLALIDLYQQRVGVPDGYWVQSWYQLPGPWLPETESYTMTHLTREVLRRLAGTSVDTTRALLEPEDGRVYHGVQTMTFTGMTDPTAGYRSVLDERTQPAVRGLFFSIPGTRGPAQSLRQLKQFFDEADSVGFIPELSLFLVSDVATDSIIAVSTVYDAVIDSIITLSKEYGRAMFLRIGGEFNGAGPNWNGGGYHPRLYVDMFRKITDMYAARGFRDSVATIWCYYPAAANDFDSTDASGALWYPGDAYVDWFGLDLFDPQDFDLALPDYDRRGITRKGKSERFLAMARAKGKPVYMSETSAKGMNISPDAADSQADWDAWFAKFFAFIDAHPEIKGYSYIDADWPEQAYAGWGDARIENSPDVSAWYLAELRDQKYIHLPHSGPTAVKTDVPLPATPMILGSHPNPFHPAATIVFSLPRESAVTLEIRDAIGRLVSRPIPDVAYARGRHSIVFDASGLPAGVYQCFLRAGEHVSLHRMLLIR